MIILTLSITLPFAPNSTPKPAVLGFSVLGLLYPGFAPPLLTLLLLFEPLALVVDC